MEKKEDALMNKIMQSVSSYKSPIGQHQEELTASNRVQASQTICSKITMQLPKRFSLNQKNPSQYG